MKFKETTYLGRKQILKFPDHYVAVPVMVTDADIVVNPDGKKIVPAGTIVAGVAAPVLSDNTQMVAHKNAAGAEGVLLEEVDVTDGPAAGAMLIHAFIKTGKLPEVPTAEAIAALKQIHFIV